MVGRIVLVLVCAALLASAAPAGEAPQFPPTAAVPPHEMFWLSPPTADASTALYWDFDEQAAGDVEDLLASGPGDLDGAKEDPALKLPTVSGAKYTLHGDAKLIGRGRFGGGLKLGAKGWLSSGTVPLSRRLGSEPALSFDFWLRPDAKAAPAVLLCIPAKLGEPLTLRRDANGTLGAFIGDEPVGRRHPLPAAAGQWTHVTFVLRQGGPCAIRVNGHSLAFEEVPGEATKGFFKRMDDRFLVGAGVDGDRSLLGEIDGVRLAWREPFLYELEDWSVYDPKAQRDRIDGPPYFRRPGPRPLYCPMDSTAEPAEFAGIRVEGKAEPEDFAPGVRGQALDLSKMSSRGLAYVGFDALPAQRGSLEFWFRPKDWNNFFIGGYRGEGVTSTNLMLQTHEHDAKAPWTAYRALRVVQGRASRDVGGLRFVPIHPGKWTHVVITWQGAQQAVYLDGEPQETGQVFLARAHESQMQHYRSWLERTGGKQDGTFRLVMADSHTLIDELRVYPWTLTGEEVSNAYHRWLPDAKERLAALPAVKAVPQYIAHNWAMVPRVQVTARAIPVDGTDPQAVAFKLLDPNGKLLHEEKGVELDESGQASFSFDQTLDFGKYAVEATSLDAAGKVLKTSRNDWDFARPAWYDNGLGVDHTVPKPWTAMKVDHKAIDVWGRTLTLDDAGLPAQIRAAGQDMLAAGAAAFATVNGQAVTLEGKGVTFTAKGDDRVEWTSKLAGGDLAADVSAWMEFDGLVHYTVTLRPAGDQPVEVQRLLLDFCLRPDDATHLICNGGARNFRASYDVRKIPAGSGSVWNARTSKPAMHKGVDYGHWVPGIWIGGDDRGLYFCGENDRGWTPDPNLANQEVLREDGVVVYRMSVIARPVTIDKARTFTFMLQPTPVKPLPEDWRAWDRRPAGEPMSQYGCGNVDGFAGWSLKDRNDNPGGRDFWIEPYSWRDARLQADGLRKLIGDNNPLLLYVDASWPTTPESFAPWRYDLFAGAGRISWTPRYRDYFVWVVNEYLKHNLIDGLYIDDFSFSATYSLDVSAYDTVGPDGNTVRRPGWNILGLRSALKRVWKLFDARGKTPHVMAHMTWCFEVPSLTYCMTMLNGEDRYMMPYEKRDTIDTWSPDELRAMGHGPKWGVASFQLIPPQYKPPAGRTAMMPYWFYWQKRAAYATMLQHDIWCGGWPAAVEVCKTFARFDLGDPKMRFVPYWRFDSLGSVQADEPNGVLAGAWVWPDRALLVVSNLSKQPRDVTVKLDPAKLFGPSAGGVRYSEADTDLEPPESIVLDAGEANTSSGVAGSGGIDLGDDGPVDLDLNAKDPKEEARKFFRLDADGAMLKIKIRKHDYRLIEVRPGN